MSTEPANKNYNKKGAKNKTACYLAFFSPTQCPAAESNLMPDWQNLGPTLTHCPLSGSTSLQLALEGPKQRYEPGVLTQTSAPESQGRTPADGITTHSSTSKYTAHTQTYLTVIRTSEQEITEWTSRHDSEIISFGEWAMIIPGTLCRETKTVSFTSEFYTQRKFYYFLSKIVKM